MDGRVFHRHHAYTTQNGGDVRAFAFLG